MTERKVIFSTACALPLTTFVSADFPFQWAKDLGYDGVEVVPDRAVTRRVLTSGELLYRPAVLHTTWMDDEIAERAVDMGDSVLEKIKKRAIRTLAFPVKSQSDQALYQIKQKYGHNLPVVCHWVGIPFDQTKDHNIAWMELHENIGYTSTVLAERTIFNRYKAFVLDTEKFPKFLARNGNSHYQGRIYRDTALVHVKPPDSTALQDILSMRTDSDFGKYLHHLKQAVQRDAAFSVEIDLITALKTRRPSELHRKVIEFIHRV